MIEARGLTKHFGKTVAVDELTVSIRPGEVTGLLGPNGAGKSTVLHMIVGLTPPTRGTATILGSRYADLPSPMREVGVLLDSRAVHGSRTAYDHLRCLAESNGLPRWRVDESLQQAGLEHVAGRRVRSLSLGMLQRLGIAAALLGDPAVLIFDEPLNGLDPEGMRWIRSLLRELAAEGRTVLVSSHLMNEMAATADRLIVLNGGRLLAAGDVEALTRPAASRAVLVRTDQTEMFARQLSACGASVRGGPESSLMVRGMECTDIHRLAVAEGVALSELAPLRMSLETVFLELTDGAADLAGRRVPEEAA